MRGNKGIKIFTESVGISCTNCQHSKERLLFSATMPIEGCKIHETVVVPHKQLVNLYGCEVGEKSFVGPFVEIQKNASVGKNTRIQSHSFICEGVHIGNNTFVGHGVMFTNDLYDSPTIKEFTLRETFVGDNVRIGSNATILPVKIGDGAIIGAGTVVTKDVPPNTTVVGNPAVVVNQSSKKKGASRRGNDGADRD